MTKTTTKAKATATPATEAPAASTKKVAAPTIEKYAFSSGWTGPSDGANKNLTRTAVDTSRFGQFPLANMTERDDKNLRALKATFGNKEFDVRNLDAGIIKRLGERGYIAVRKSGRFALTAKATAEVKAPVAE
jgi:hypothetical protein